MAGSGAEERCRRAHGVGEPSHEVGREKGRAGPGLLDHRRAVGLRERAEVDDRRPDRGLVGSPGVEPAGDVARDGIDPVRLHADLAHCRDAAPRGGDLACGQDGLGIPEHGVAAVLEAGRARVVRGAGHVDAPAPVGPDVGADGDGGGGGAEIGERAALLDVELDEGGDPAERLVVAAQCRGVAPERLQRLGHRQAVAVTQAQGALCWQRPGDDPRAGAGDPKAGTLLVDEADHGDRDGGGEPGRAEAVDGRQRGDDPERTVEGAAVGHRVEVGPHGHPAARAVGPDHVGVSPPGPLVAGAVLHDVQAPGGALAGEPLPQVGVLTGPREAAVATRAGVAADLLERRPHRVEGPPCVERPPCVRQLGGPGDRRAGRTG